VILLSLPPQKKEKQPKKREIGGDRGEVGPNRNRNTWRHIRTIARRKKKHHRRRDREGRHMITYKLERKHVQFHLVILQLSQLSLLSP